MTSPLLAALRQVPACPQGYRGHRHAPNCWEARPSLHKGHIEFATSMRSRDFQAASKGLLSRSRLKPEVIRAASSGHPVPQIEPETSPTPAPTCNLLTRL